MISEYNRSGERCKRKEIVPIPITNVALRLSSNATLHLQIL